MSEKLTVGELVYKISGDMDNLKTELKRSDTEMKKLKDTMEKQNTTTKKMTQGFRAAKAAVISFISGALIRGIYQIAQSGSELQTLTNSFNQLTSDLGLNADEVQSSLSKMSGGTIANKDLIAAANRAMVLGVAKDMDEFNTLMGTARLRARDMGISTTQAFDNIVTGIGRGSPLILDNLGFIVSATQAQEEYAKKLGTTAEKLTETQKKEALKSSILSQGTAEMERAGEVTANYADRLAQASTVITNIKDNIGRAMLPAMASLLDATLEGNEGFLQTTEQVNKLGREFYRVAQILLVVGKTFKTVGLGISAFGKSTQIAITKVLEVITKFRIAVKKAAGEDTSVLENTLKSYNDVTKKLLDEIAENGKEVIKTSEEMGDSMNEALDPTKYKGLTDGQLAALINDTADSLDNTGGAADDAEEKVEDFTDKLISLRDEAVKTRQELEDKLKESFEDFGKGLKDNFEESVTSLAQVVIAAEEAKKDIKKALRDEDLTSERRRELKDELKAQEEILKARKDFEERQAESVLAIRKKLEDAGIDAAEAGLDGLLDVRSLEEQLEEERRVASLDEFTRLEEEQTRKLTALTDAFILEATLQKDKIKKQKGYEEEITTFLINEDAKRLANTEAWASDTLDEYGKLAKSLQGLISQQTQLNALRAAGGVSTVSRSTPSSNTTNSSVVNNTRTVNAPINISSNQSDAELSDLSKEIAWELGRK